MLFLDKFELTLKKGNLLVFCFIFCSVFSVAQTTYIKTLGGSGDDVAHAAIETNDGNYLIIGATSSFGSGEKDGYVAKVNVAAKEIWDKAIGGSGNDEFLNGVQLNSGNFVLVGWTNSNGGGGQDILVTCLNNFGAVLWSKTFGDSDDDVGYNVIETSDGNILLVGESDRAIDQEIHIQVIKLTYNGDQIWSKKIASKNTISDNGPGVFEDVEGNYLVSGQFALSTAFADAAATTFKFDPSGNWVESKMYKTFEKSTFDGFTSITGTGFQNFGQSYGFSGITQNIIMTDFTPTGEVNWSKSISLPAKRVILNSVIRKSNGNYLLSGQEVKTNPNSTYFALLMEISPLGDLIWSQKYGGDGIDDLQAVFETSNGIIAFGNSFASFNTNQTDVFAVRANELGTVSGCSDFVALGITDISPVVSDITPEIEDMSFGNSQFLNVANVDFNEELICDGCNSDDLTAGLFCEEAPIICSIDCLDGFTGTLPDSLIMPQPDPLCDGGIANNVSWFAFVAGSNTIDLSIIPSNCTTIYNEAGDMPQTIGIQAGVYEDCSFENSFICQTDGCLDLDAETINISSNDFVIGHVYYLFVDGCGGSVCDYEVVVNSAQQAFEMDEITSISNDLNLDLEEDTLCLGASITFSLNDFDLDVNFNWSIDPPTSDYPSGVHPVTDTSAVTFEFTEAGCFDIHVYAFNECDNSETQTISICVEALEDEIFTDISVCQECFPITLVSPESGCIITEGGGAPTVLIEDPNGDGVPGWLGTSTINGPGLDSNVVTNIYGCTYTQYVNVVEIPLSPREQVDYYFCLNDFPVDIGETIFNSPGDTQNVTLDGGASSGCDSLMSITAHGIDFLGFSSIGNCEAGEVELAINVDNISIDNYDDIIYVWYDQNGDVIMDSDGIDSIMVVTGVGSYSVQVGVVAGGITCFQTFGPFMIDVDNLSPDIPMIAYSPLEMCVSEEEAIIYVANQNLGENYVWTFTPNMPFNFGVTADTVYVDITNGQSFEYCVHAVNGCGSSMQICENVEINESPLSDFSFTSDICINEISTIEYTGTTVVSSSSTFNWDFDGGVITNGMDPNSAGPFEISFPTAGQYTISLVVSESGCNSIRTEHLVNVVEPFTPPMIVCESDLGMVTFSWDDTNVDTIDIIVLTGQTAVIIESNSLVIDQLGSEEEISMQILFNGEDLCGGVLVTENCTSLPCPDVALEINLSEQEACLTDDAQVSVGITIIGDDTGFGSWESEFLSNDNLFDVNAAGEGQHLVTYVYELGDCTFSVDTTITVIALPVGEVETSLSYCEEMGASTIDIITDITNTVLLDDGEVIDLMEIAVDEGDHIVTIVNPSGCQTEMEITIESLSVEDLLVNGSSNLIKGETETYAATYISDIEDLILVWTLDGDTICVNCFEVEISPEEDQELCVSIEFGEECIVEDCMSIEISERTKIFVPNIFSPNNDNLNDLFTIQSNNNNVFIQEIMVFDRWGEMVFTKEEFNLTEESYNWDGKYNGATCQPGVYVYIITYLDEQDQVKQITGDLTLIR